MLTHGHKLSPAPAAGLVAPLCSPCPGDSLSPCCPGLLPPVSPQPCQPLWGYGGSAHHSCLCPAGEAAPGNAARLLSRPHPGAWPAAQPLHVSSRVLWFALKGRLCPHKLQTLDGSEPGSKGRVSWARIQPPEQELQVLATSKRGQAHRKGQAGMSQNQVNAFGNELPRLPSGPRGPQWNS